MDLRTLIAADGVHARDVTALERLDASTARRVREKTDADAFSAQPSVFASHETYAVARASDDAPSDARDHVHVFRLRDDVREAMTSALLPLALAKFRRGREDEARSLGGAVPGPGSDVSVIRSNRGGYQSYADLLDSEDEDEDEDEDADAARAVGDAGDDAGDALGTPSRARSGSKTTAPWALVTDIALEAYARVRSPSQRADVRARDVYGWLNVNAPGDYNRLHAHDDVDRWSGVVYLAVPDLTATPQVPPDAGALGVRASELASASSTDAAVAYFVHPPAVGDLVVFSGAALHAVSAFPAPTGVDPPRETDDTYPFPALRVSVAFNVDC